MNLMILRKLNLLIAVTGIMETVLIENTSLIIRLNADFGDKTCARRILSYIKKRDYSARVEIFETKSYVHSYGH